MTNIIYPWRHNIISNYVASKFSDIFQSSSKEISELLDVDWKPLKTTWSFEKLIVPITSANHSNTRRNPIRAERRVEALLDFGKTSNIPIYPYMVDDRWKMDNFASYTIMSTNVAAANEWYNEPITPENSIIACSNKELIPLYIELWYQVLPLEFDGENEEYHQKQTWEILKKTFDLHKENKKDSMEYAETMMYKSSFEMFKKYDFFEHCYRLHEDKILDDDWNFDNTIRDYRLYEESFKTASPRKYNQIKEYIKPWVVVDIWCAWWWLIACATKDERLDGSTYIGVEMSRTLYDVAVQNMKKVNYPHTHIYHWNWVDELFVPDNSVDTVISFSTTHEVISYGNESSLAIFTDNIHKKLKTWSVRINVDVVWPNEKDKRVIIDLDTEDGIWFDQSIFDISIKTYHQKIETAQTDGDKQDAKQWFADYLGSLSTFWRLFVFQQTFQKSHTPWGYQFEILDKENGTIRIRNQDIYEFMPKVDYLKNWLDECNEAFCTMSCDDWQEFGKSHNFDCEVIPDRNKWIYDNRYWKINKDTWQKRFTVYEDNNWSKWRELSYEPTNVKVIAKKKVPEIAA